MEHMCRQGLIRNIKHHNELYLFINNANDHDSEGLITNNSTVIVIIVIIIINVDITKLKEQEDTIIPMSMKHIVDDEANGINSRRATMSIKYGPAHNESLVSKSDSNNNTKNKRNDLTSLVSNQMSRVRPTRIHKERN
eukprot:468106_1